MRVIRGVLTVALAIGAMLAAAGDARAQEELDDNRTVEERKEPVTTMSEPVYRRLEAIHELIGNGEGAEALKRCTTMLEKSRLSDYERALILQAAGFVHAGEDRFPQAIDYFEKSLALNSLPTAAQQGMLYSLAGLYATQEQFLKAIETARRWFKFEPDPKAEAFMLIGSSFSQLERYSDALPYVQKAIQKKDEPQESWYQLEMAIYFETKQIPKAVPLLQKMIQYWPEKRQYWETLSGAHMEIGQDRQALSTMMVAYHKGLTVEEKKILDLVRLNMFLDIPFTGGQILADEMAAGRVERNQEHLDLLEQAWTAAQEYDKALEIMTELGELTGDAEYAIRQAKVYNELTRWEDVVATANRAIEQGYDDKGEAYLLIGTAYSEMGRLRDSLAAFKKAEDTGDADQRRNARAWIGFVNDRLKIAS